MESSAELAGRLREVLLNGTWIANTNYKKLLNEIDWITATKKVNHLNSIAALTYHINYYLHGLLNVFRGGQLTIRDAHSFDAPPIRSQADWESLRNDLYLNAEDFAKAVEKLTTEQLESTFVKQQYGSYRRNIEGVIEHSYYHLGQMSLILKLLKQHKKDDKAQ